MSRNAWDDLKAARAARENGSITIGFVRDRIAARYGMSGAEDLAAASRERVVVHVRHIAMWAAHRLTGRSNGAIGVQFGGRDWTTVRYSIRKIEERRGRDPQFAALLAGILEDLQKDWAARAAA